MAQTSLPPNVVAMNKLFKIFTDHTRAVYALPTSILIPDPQPSLTVAWENFVKDCEDMELIGATFCKFCEGEPGPDGVLEHADHCVFEAMDQAMARSRR